MRRALAEITRTAVGEFSLEQAIPLEELPGEAGRQIRGLPDPLENLLPNFPRAMFFQ